MYMHMWEGHIVFRDPSVLRSINPKVDPAVFAQNLKNASVPSWKGFVKSLSKGQRELHPFLPDNHPGGEGSPPFIGP